MSFDRKLMWIGLACAAVCFLIVAVDQWNVRRRAAVARRLTDDRRTVEQLAAGTAIEQEFADIKLQQEYDRRVRLNKQRRAAVRSQIRVITGGKPTPILEFPFRRQAN